MEHVTLLYCFMSYSYSDNCGGIDMDIPLKLNLKTALVIEDDPIVAEGISLMLSDMGYIPLHLIAPNETSLESLNDGFVFDLIVTDIVMPDVSGFDIVRSLSTLFNHIPIIAISSHKKLADNLVKESRDKGRRITSLEKPITEKSLAEALQNLDEK